MRNFPQARYVVKGGRADIRLGRSWLHGALKSAAPRAANDFENLKSSRCPLVPEEKGLEDCLGESLTTNQLNKQRVVQRSLAELVRRLKLNFTLVAIYDKDDIPL